DLLENTNLVLCEEKQRIAALILESIVSLLRTEIQQGFRAYLRAIKENKATFSRDAMNNFLNNSITPNQRKYRFGDNVEAIYGRWSYENKEYMKITSRGGIRVNVKHSHYAPYIKQLAQSGDYRTLIEELRTTRKRISSSDITKTVDDSLIATDLLDNTDYSLSIITQQDAASVLEAIVGLAEEWRKQGAAKLFRGYLRAVQAGRTGLSIENMRKHFKFAYDATSAREEYRKRTSGPQLGRKQVARARRAKADPIALDKLEQYDSAEHLVYGYLSDDEEGDYNSEDELRERKGSEVITKRDEETGEEKEVKIKRKVDFRDDELFQDKKSE
ncbi:MAG: hypothetical protein MI674_06215, partial [Cytophagales bacterium]|nr:hypothetical protein [Cytophagales bacterium]